MSGKLEIPSQIRGEKAARVLFAVGMMGLGILAFVMGHLGLRWYSIPGWLPWPSGVAYASGVILFGSGAGLLLDRTSLRAMQILFPYLVLWLLLRIPSLVKAPLTEVNWQNAGELAVLVAGAWTLLSWLRDSPLMRANGRAVTARIPRLLFVASLIAFGLSHFVYAKETSGLVPAWLPFHSSWAYVTGSAHIAAGLGVAFMVYPRLAATLEAAMLSAFTLIIWIPAVVMTPTDPGQWTELVISTAVTAGAWVMAESIAKNYSTSRLTP